MTLLPTHTPGPWAVNDSDIEHAESGMSICTVRSSEDFPCITGDEGKTEDEARRDVDAECAANRFLICAAPDMFAALDNIVTSEIFNIAVNDVEVSADRLRAIVGEVYEAASAAWNKAKGY